MKKPILAFLFIVICVGGPASAGPLQDAAKSGDVATIIALLKAGADINDRSGLAPPVFYAIQNNHERAALTLIKMGADPDVMSVWGTPLHAAATVNTPMAAAWLIGYGANPNARWNEMTPLHLAARNGHIDMVRVLLDRGADIDALTRFEEPAIHLALLHGHQEVADLLRARGSEAPTVDDISDLLPTANVEHGAEVAFGCKKCHVMDQVVPTVCRGGSLWNIVNRPKAFGTTEFSPALRAAGGVWSYDDLNVYLAQPAWTLPGTTMLMQGIHDPQDRADLIAYLRTLSDNPAPLPGH